jgi:hypothetical protein
MEVKTPRDALEMIELGEDIQWRQLQGFPGLEFFPLGDTLDEQNGRGARTRLVRFAPGAETTARLVHPYWEEVLIISGELSNANPATGAEEEAGGPSARRAHTPLRYSLRPPGTSHGPFVSRTGCILFEVQYFLAE